MLKSISLRLCTLIVLLFAGISSFAQQVQVKGTVVEKSSGESIIGASVMEVGSNSNGTITDIDGNFILSVASGATLSVSYIGYKTVTVKAQPILRIELTEDSQLIDEVVVTGYMSEKKASLTGSVAVVKMKDVADIPTGNVLSSLQGRVAGMNITTDGTPGGGNTSTLVRGKSSFRNDANSPLYVIDGVMTRENISSILSSNDVEFVMSLSQPCVYLVRVSYDLCRVSILLCLQLLRLISHSFLAYSAHSFYQQLSQIAFSPFSRYLSCC